MRRSSLAGRLSFAAATRMAFRRVPVPPGRGFLSLSFDDIPLSAWTEGGPILSRHGLRASYYLSGDLCGKVFENREQYRQDDIADIIAAGHEIGSHLFHHVSTLTLSPNQMRREIALNDAFLKQAVGQDFMARSFAYPYGEISVAAKWLCNRRFLASRSVMPGLNSNGADAGQLRILPIDNIFAAETDIGAGIAAAARDGAWAILLAHGVDNTGHAFSCPPSRLEAVIERAMAAGLEILPVAEVMDRLTSSRS
ncbi:polysaccharide deacetylase family protein [Tabrizicola sp.]|uniref:polysaccharide deacetylase family protein n=1 Tax=Tabrizicola sp. TaxID=2005166 RepID=UPI0026389784|nr:polysaccharide deacetylase family protein [Tabrizicola sp.]MDM7932752.1 polysaccharide deacetylase family protein [Tabrizicola sp.]